MAKNETSPSGLKEPTKGFKGFKLSKNFFSSAKALIYSALGLAIAEMTYNGWIGQALGVLVLNVIGRALEFWVKKYE